MSDDKLIYKINWHYGIEKMSGKKGTYIIRKRNGLIAAFIETQGQNITAFTPHQNRRLPKRIINKVANHIIKNGYYISKDSARAMGISSIRASDGSITYLSSSTLRRKGLGAFIHKEAIEHITIHNLYKQKIIIPDDSHNKSFDLQHANLSTLQIGENVHGEIDLRDNAVVDDVLINDNFNGKLYLSQSNLKNLKLKENCHAEIIYTMGLNRLKVDIGQNFSGSIMMKNTYLDYMRIASRCLAQIRLELCICYNEISLGKESTSEILCSSVFAKYFALGSSFSGHLEGLSQSAKQGVRNLYIGHNFSGHIDLSNSNTIERVEIGADSDGTIDLNGCKSIRLIRIEKNFSGELNLTESDIVYVRAEAPCFGEFNFAETEKLTQVILPEKKEYKILGISRKPIKAQRMKNGMVTYTFRQLKLPRGYFISTAPSGLLQYIIKRLFQ